MRFLAPRVGSYEATLDLEAETFVRWLAEALDQQEIEAWRHAVSVWAARTAGADPDAAQKAFPTKPECLQDEFGD